MGDGRAATAVAGGQLRVLIVDDHELLAYVLSSSLLDAGFVTNVVTGAELTNVASIALDFGPDVTLLDLDLGAGRQGKDWIEPLVDQGLRVLMLTGSTDAAVIGEGLELGATGVLTKDAPFEAVVSAIVEAAAGHTALFSERRHHCLAAVRDKKARDRERMRLFELLTPREQEVLKGLSNGLTASAIAEVSFVSLSTVRSQIRSVLTKLGVSSQIAAVAIAHELEWL